MVQRQQIADGIAADQQQPGQRHGLARTALRQAALAPQAYRPQHRQGKDEAPQQEAERGGVRQPPFGEDRAAAPQQHEQGGGAVSGPRGSIERHEVSPVRVRTGSSPAPACRDYRQTGTDQRRLGRAIRVNPSCALTTDKDWSGEFGGQPNTTAKGGCTPETTPAGGEAGGETTAETIANTTGETTGEIAAGAAGIRPACADHARAPRPAAEAAAAKSA
ncbi:hypothetical protein G6F57_016419 [Rhizopus arrhizus]|nr:hypothetical protein G6F57_016419 [Rhizopus arrhizus]